MNLPIKNFCVVLVGLLVVGLVVPAQVAASHVYQTPRPNRVVRQNGSVLGAVYGVTSSVGEVLGEAAEATVEGTQSLWQRFTGWLAGIFGSKDTTIVKKTTQVVKAPLPTSVPQVTEVPEVTKVIEQAVGVSADDLAGVGLYASGDTLNVNVGLKAYKIVQLDKDGKLPAGLDAANLSNLNADQIKGGTVSSDRITGKYLSISGVGTVLEGKWEGSVIADTYIANDLTLNSIGTAESTSDLTINARGGQFVLTDTQTLAIGGATTGLAYNVIGDNTTSANTTNMTSDDDLYIEGNLEVDGTIYGTVSGTITTGFTEGSVTFADASGNLAQDNANFFWNDTTNRLGLGDATPDDRLDVESSILGYNFLFGTNGVTLSTSGTGGINVDTYGQLSFTGYQSAASAVELVSVNGGIDLSTGSGSADIDILSGDAINLSADNGAITISTGGNQSNGGDLTLRAGDSILVQAEEGVANAVALIAPAGGIDISTGTGTAGQDIDILSGTSINLTAREAIANAIVISASEGGIDISTGSGSQDIDILGGDAINLSADNGAITISTGGNQSNGGDLNIRAGDSVLIRAEEGAADAITITAEAGGIDISTGGSAADIDILGGDKINITSKRQAADGIALVVTEGGIDISTGTGTAGQDIDILSGTSINITAREAVADAIVISAPNQGGIDISTGYDAGVGQAIDILGGSTINLKAANGDVSISAGSITTSSGLAVDSATGKVGIWTNAPDTTAGLALQVAGEVKLQLDGGASSAAVCGSHGTGTSGDVTDVTLRDCSAAPGNDYAEFYPTAAGIGFGDVVVTSKKLVETKADDGKGNIVEGAKKYVPEMVRSSVPYQYNVVGVVVNNYADFTSTGHNIVNPKDNPMPVALNGRVPVKVTGEGGSIEIGDYLATSSTPGHAMKATGEGMVIGMALTEFSGGKDDKGEVTVFVGKWYVDESVYEQKELLAALGMEQVNEQIGEVLGAQTEVVEQADGVGGVLATSDSNALASGNDPLPVLKTQTLDELTVTTDAQFQGTLVVVGEAIFEGLLTVNGAEVKGDLGVVGAVTQTFTAGEEVATGDAVYLAAENTVRKASAGSEGTLPAVGIAANSAGAGSGVKVAIAGTVSGLANLNAGRRYYVGVGSGSITVTAPSAAGQGVQVIGVARSASQLVVMPGLDYSTNAGTIPAEPVAVPVPSTEPVVVPSPVLTPTVTPEPSIAPEASQSAVSQ